MAAVILEMSSSLCPTSH